MAFFFHSTLRTSDVPAAAAFYAALLGGQALDIVQLHEAAVARGARPHWLGYLDAGPVAHAVQLFREQGATPLGPRFVRLEDVEVEILRDPGGAVVALASPPKDRPTAPVGPEVAWRLLHTKDVARAKRNYAELCGWEFKPPLDLGAEGAFHPFSVEPGGPEVGALRDVGAHPGLHAHWLLFLRVPSLDAAVAATRAAGGKAMDVQTLSSGARLAACDDPQGAAFGLWEDRRA